MQTKPIGRSGLQTGPISLGTMTYGNPVAYDDAVALTRYAIDQGITLIDTANMYEGYDRVAGSAGGVAETIVGEAVRGVRDRVILATKVGMKVGPAPEDEGTSAAAIRKQLQASLQRLGTNRIDIYYLHRPDDPALTEDTLRELAHARRHGAIGCYGVSNYDADQLALLLEAARQLGVEAPSACQPPLSLLKPEATARLLPLCAREGIAVFPYQVYQGGLLTGKYRRGDAPPPQSRGAEKPDWLWSMDDALYTRLESIARDAAAEGLPMAAYALHWALRQPAVVSAVIGVKRREQIDDALRAAEASPVA